MLHYLPSEYPERPKYIQLYREMAARIARIQPPVNTADIEADIVVRLQELITDALLMGLTPDRFREIMIEQLDRLNE